MFYLSLMSIFIGVLLTFFGCWFTFLTIMNILLKGKYVLFVLLLAATLVSVGVTLFMLGVLL